MGSAPAVTMVASIEAAPAVTIVLTVVTVIVIAGYLIAIGAILKGVSGRLDIILGAVSEVVEKTAPAGDVIGAINADLAAGHAALDGAVARLQERIADDDLTGGDAAPAGSGPGGWWQQQQQQH